MRIAFLGNFAVDYSSESHHAKSLESLGHEVIRIQEPGGLEHGVREPIDMFVWVHTHNWEVPGINTMLGWCRDNRIPIVAYHLDLYRGIPSRWREYEDDPYMRSLDHFFTADGPLADWLNENTPVKGHYLPPGVFHKETTPVTSVPKPRDVIFVGSYHYHPEWPYRRKLIDWLADTYGDRFTLFGGNRLPGEVATVVRGKALNDLYSKTKVVVGDTFCPDYTYGPYYSDRVPETLGRGGFLIMPNVPGLTADYTRGEHLATYDFDDFDGLKTMINYFLADDERRELMRRAGHQHVCDHHTYKHRWAQIIKTVFG